LTAYLLFARFIHILFVCLFVLCVLLLSLAMFTVLI